jgi:murein DD-endopeptidase MepM/ murein hydrolase activator NlpD
LILVGDRSSTIRKVRVPERRLQAAAILLAAIAVTGAGVIAHYAYMLASRGDARAIRDENERLRTQLHAVEERIAHISSTLDRVAQFDATLRGTVKKLQNVVPSTSPATPTAPPPGTAMGGPVSDAPDLAARLNSLDRAAVSQESSLRSLNDYFEGQRSLLSATPTAWPARGWVTSDYGMRLDPYTAERMMHRGLDIATPPGNPVLAPSDGTVSFAGTEEGYGKVLVIDHGNGVNTRYGHLSVIYVKPGQRVKRGARVAAVGNTGRSTGPHLHYEVRVNGVAENPRKFLME